VWLTLRPLLTRALGFVATWVTLWLLLWQLAPTWFVASRAGLQTALQVLPAIIVSLLVLVLGSLFVVSQAAASGFGSQATFALARDPRAQGLVIGPLVLAFAAVLLSGQVPDTGEPEAWITAGVTTVALATCWRLLRSAWGMYWMLQQFGDPRRYARMVERQLRADLKRRNATLVASDLHILADMLRTSVRLRDDAGIEASLTVIQAGVTAVIETARQASELRPPSPDDDAWFGRSLAAALAGAYDEAIRPEASADAFHTLTRHAIALAVKFLRAGREQDARTIVFGLTAVGVRPELQGPSTAPRRAQHVAAALGRIEKEAEEPANEGVAAMSLAGWSMVQANARLVPDQQAADRATARGLGQHPPWSGARKVLQSRHWSDRWGDAFDGTLQPAGDVLALAEGRQGARTTDGDPVVKETPGGNAA
jgi:hypothetical protein